MRLRLRAYLLVSALGSLALIVGALADSAPARHARAAAGKGTGRAYTAKVSYTETNHGRQHGTATLGIVGHGTFSVKLGAGARLEAAVLALVTGVPVSEIAQGGKYALERSIAGNGVVTGTVAARLKARGLGTVCVTLTATPGHFMPGQSFVPMSGTLTVAGGSGQAAHWRGSAQFKQTDVTGMSIEHLTGSGSEHASIGKSRGLSAACKHVASML